MSTQRQPCNHPDPGQTSRDTPPQSLLAPFFLSSPSALRSVFQWNAIPIHPSSIVQIAVVPRREMSRSRPSDVSSRSDEIIFLAVDVVLDIVR